jgi:single-strand DNA-binding protein
MLNHIVLMGRLTRDPEMRRTGSGIAVASFTIACERDMKNSNGEKETDFIDVTAWRNTAEFVEKYFSKGRMAVVSGRLQIRSWTDKDGNKRKTAEVVADNVYFGDSKPEGSSGGSYSTQASGSYAAPVTTQASDFAMLEDDDSQLPF